MAWNPVSLLQEWRLLLTNKLNKITEKKQRQGMPKGTYRVMLSWARQAAFVISEGFLLRNARTENRVTWLSCAGESIRTGFCFLHLYRMFENSSLSGAKTRFESFVFDLQPKRRLQFSLPKRDERARELAGKSAVPTLWLSVYIPPKTSCTRTFIMYVTTYDSCGWFICSFILTLLWCWRPSSRTVA